MRHKQYVRTDVTTNERTVVPFDENHGVPFSAVYNDGYDTKTALLIVNRWNCLSADGANTIIWMYHLPTAEGGSI
jgi:hypothetical protein